MNRIEQLRKELEAEQLKALEEIENGWNGELKSFDEAKKLLEKFNGIEIILPWIKRPFEDIYGQDLKKKEWEEYVLSGICGKRVSERHKKEGFDNYSLIADDYLNEGIENRGSNVYLIDMLKDSLLDDYFESEDEMIPVLTSRTTSNYMGGKDRVDGLLYQIEIPALQYVTDIIKWCLKNKCTGYKFDW